MTAMAHSIFTYKSCPTKAELEHVAQEMINCKFLAALGTVILKYAIPLQPIPCMDGQQPN